MDQPREGASGKTSRSLYSIIRYFDNGEAGTQVRGTGDLARSRSGEAQAGIEQRVSYVGIAAVGASS